jgi:hypothetical protein
MSYAENVRVSMQYEAGLQAGAMEEHFRVMSSPHVSEAAKREVAEDFRLRLQHPRIPTNPATTKGYTL